MALTKVTSGLISADASSVDLNIDAGTLYIDSTNNRVGIGTSSPTEKLTVSGALAITGALVDDRTSTGAIDFSGGITRFVSYGASGVGGIFAFRTASGGSSSTERMRIDSSGNVGIGTSSPTTTLHAYSSATSTPFVVESTTNTYLGIKNTSQTAYVGAVGTAMIFENNGSERMRIDGSGNVTLYNNQLKFSNTSYENRSLGIDSGGFFIYNDADARYDIKIDSNGYLYNPSMLGSASANSDVRFNTSDGLIYYQTSSQRYKENIQDLPSVLDKVNALRPVTFDEIATGNSCFGLIAEEVVEQIPELVNLREIEGYDEPQPDNIPYSMLSVYLLKAIQEQQAIIDDLKARIQTLEGN